MTLKYADQVKKGFMIDSKNARIKRRSYPVNPTVITLLPFREKFWDQDSVLVVQASMVIYAFLEKVLYRERN